MIFPKTQSKLTRCVLETWRMCGLLPLIVSLITALNVLHKKQPSTPVGKWCVWWIIMNGFLATSGCLVFELARRSSLQQESNKGVRSSNGPPSRRTAHVTCTPSTSPLEASYSPPSLSNTISRSVTPAALTQNRIA